MTPQPEIILFHYPESIYSQRVLWYLQLRGIKYSECIQPSIMPRPDLAELGIAYRRIPILAIGHDVYCDSRIIIEALEKHVPNNGRMEDIKHPDQEGIRQLLESYSIDGGVFWRAVSLLPMDKVEFLKDPKFLADREAMLGGPLDVAGMQKERLGSLAALRQIFDRIESTFLADGRDWILGTAEPTRADLDAVWAPQWLFRDPHFGGTIPEEFVSEQLFPKTFAWMDRFLVAADEAKAEGPEVKTLNGKEAIDRIMESGEGTGVYDVDADDPLQLLLGTPVAVNPTDMATSHIDYGKLATLKKHEIAIVNDKGVWLHFPRWNFQVQAAGASIP